MSKFIKDWDELRQIPNESETHILEVGECNGWIRAKVNEYEHPEIRKQNKNKHWKDRLPNLNHYLSTHAFYGKTCKGYTELLQACGFDVELANWDELGL